MSDSEGETERQELQRMLGLRSSTDLDSPDVTPKSTMLIRKARADSDEEDDDSEEESEEDEEDDDATPSFAKAGGFLDATAAKLKAQQEEAEAAQLAAEQYKASRVGFVEIGRETTLTLPPVHQSQSARNASGHRNQGTDIPLSMVTKAQGQRGHIGGSPMVARSADFAVRRDRARLLKGPEPETHDFPRLGITIKGHHNTQWDHVELMLQAAEDKMTEQGKVMEMQKHQLTHLLKKLPQLGVSRATSLVPLPPNRMESHSLLKYESKYVHQNSVGVQASATPWTRFFFPKFDNLDSPQNSFFQHFDVCLKDLDHPEERVMGELRAGVPAWLNERFRTLYYKQSGERLGATGIKDDAKAFAYASKDMAEAPGHLFVAKNKTIRLEMQQFCRVVARMSAMEDDLPALNALLSGLLVYVADQLDVLEEGVHAQIEIRERHVRNQLRAKVQHVMDEMLSCDDTHDTSCVDELLRGFAPLKKSSLVTQLFESQEQVRELSERMAQVREADEHMHAEIQTAKKTILARDEAIQTLEERVAELKRRNLHNQEEMLKMKEAHEREVASMKGECANHQHGVRCVLQDLCTALYDLGTKVPEHLQEAASEPEMGYVYQDAAMRETCSALEEAARLAVAELEQLPVQIRKQDSALACTRMEKEMYQQEAQLLRRQARDAEQQLFQEQDVHNQLLKDLVEEAGQAKEELVHGFTRQLKDLQEELARVTAQKTQLSLQRMEELLAFGRKASEQDQQLSLERVRVAEMQRLMAELKKELAAMDKGNADMLAANSNHAADQTSKLHDMHSKLETMVEQHLVPMIDEEDEEMREILAELASMKEGIQQVATEENKGVAVYSQKRIVRRMRQLNSAMQVHLEGKEEGGKVDTVWRQNSEAVDSQLDHMERALDETYKLRDMHKGIKVLARENSRNLLMRMRTELDVNSEDSHTVQFVQDYVSTAMAKIKVDQLQDSTLAQLELAESHQHAGPLHPRGPRGLPPRRSSIGPSVLGRSNLGAGVAKRLRSKTMRVSMIGSASSPSRSGEGLLRAQASSKEMVLATTEGPRSEDVRGAVARAPHKHLPRGVANVYQLLMQAPNNINTMAVNSHVVSALEVMPRDAAAAVLWEAGAEKRGDILQMVAPLTLEELMMSLSPQKAGQVLLAAAVQQAKAAMTALHRHDRAHAILTTMSSTHRADLTSLMSPYERAEELGKMSLAAAASTLEHMLPDTAKETVLHLQGSHQVRVLEEMSMVSATLALSHMSPGKAASLLAQMNPDRATSNLLQMRPERAASVLTALMHTPDRVLPLMCRVPALEAGQVASHMAPAEVEALSRYQETCAVSLLKNCAHLRTGTLRQSKPLTWEAEWRSEWHALMGTVRAQTLESSIEAERHALASMPAGEAAATERRIVQAKSPWNQDEEMVVHSRIESKQALHRKTMASLIELQTSLGNLEELAVAVVSSTGAGDDELKGTLGSLKSVKTAIGDSVNLRMMSVEMLNEKYNSAMSTLRSATQALKNSIAKAAKHVESLESSGANAVRVVSELSGALTENLRAPNAQEGPQRDVAVLQNCLVKMEELIYEFVDAFGSRREIPQDLQTSLEYLQRMHENVDKQSDSKEADSKLNMARLFNDTLKLVGQASRALDLAHSAAKSVAAEASRATHKRQLLLSIEAAEGQAHKTLQAEPPAAPLGGGGTESGPRKPKVTRRRSLAVEAAKPDVPRMKRMSAGDHRSPRTTTTTSPPDWVKPGGKSAALPTQGAGSTENPSPRLPGTHGQSKKLVLEDKAVLCRLLEVSAPPELVAPRGRKGRAGNLGKRGGVLEALFGAEGEWAQAQSARQLDELYHQGMEYMLVTYGMHCTLAQEVSTGVSTNTSGQGLQTEHTQIPQDDSASRMGITVTSASRPARESIERVPQLQVVRSTNKAVSSGELLDAESEHAKLHHTAVHTLSSTAHKGWTGIAMVTVLPVVVNKKVWGSLAFYKHKGEQGHAEHNAVKRDMKDVAQGISQVMTYSKNSFGTSVESMRRLNRMIVQNSLRAMQALHSSSEHAASTLDTDRWNKEREFQIQQVKVSQLQRSRKQVEHSLSEEQMRKELLEVTKLPSPNRATIIVVSAVYYVANGNPYPLTMEEMTAPRDVPETKWTTIWSNIEDQLGPAIVGKMKAYDSFANNVNNDVMHTLIPSTPLEDTQSSSFEIVGLLHEWLWVVAQLHESTVNTKAAQKALDHVEERLDLKNSNHRVSYHE